LQQQGIDPGKICDEIQQEGVAALSTSFKKLMHAVAEKGLSPQRP
jgi:hypothetical protein